MRGEALAASLLAAAAGLAWFSDGWLAGHRLRGAMPRAVRRPGAYPGLRGRLRPSRLLLRGRWLLPASVALAAIGGTGMLVTAGPLPVVAAILIAVALRARQSRRSKARARLRREATVELAVSLVAELRGGRAPGGALVVAVCGLPPGDLRAELAAAAGAAEAGTDYVPLLAAAAAEPGAAGLRRVAACFRLSLSGGAGLASALERVVIGLRDEAAVRREVLAQLAGPRATARLLAGLPVFGLVLGTGLGAEPLPLLLGTPLGLAALGVGAALAVAGWAWTERLARAVEALT